jgi:hypothetical protein
MKKAIPAILTVCMLIMTPRAALCGDAVWIGGDCGDRYAAERTIRLADGRDFRFLLLQGGGEAGLLETTPEAAAARFNNVMAAIMGNAALAAMSVKPVARPPVVLSRGTAPSLRADLTKQAGEPGAVTPQIDPVASALRSMMSATGDAIPPGTTLTIVTQTAAEKSREVKISSSSAAPAY